jgi:hypothetical protein
MVWIPGYERIDLGPDGGPYDETRHPKGCLHTTEGSTLAGAESAYRNYPPHIGYDPVKRIKRQYVRLDRYSYAFKGSESDDEYVIQVEMVGFARQTHLWSDQVYRNIAEDVIKPLEDLIGIPRTALNFHGEGEGIILAHKDSPIRLSSTALRNYSGWLGHQHIPSPDAHWDPGRFLIWKCFNHLASLVPQPPVEEKDFNMTVRLVRGNSENLDPEGRPWGHRVFMVRYDPSLPEGAVRTYLSDSPVYRTLLKGQGSVDVVEQKDLDAIPMYSPPVQPPTDFPTEPPVDS